VQRDPLQIQGTAAFSAGPQIKGVQWVTVNGTFKAVLDDPFVIELSGNANLIEKYFGTRFQLGSAFVRYSSTGLFEFAGDQNWDLKVAYANGHLGGFVDGLEAASIEGRERVCIRVPLISDPCAGAGLIASSIGIAACVEASFVKECPAPLLILPGNDPFHPTPISHRICAEAPDATCLDVDCRSPEKIEDTKRRVREFLRAHAR